MMGGKAECTPTCREGIEPVSTSGDKLVGKVVISSPVDGG